MGLFTFPEGSDLQTWLDTSPAHVSKEREEKPRRGSDPQTWDTDFAKVAYIADKKIDEALDAVAKSLDKNSSQQFTFHAQHVQQGYAARFRQNVNDKGLEVETDLGPLLWEYVGTLKKELNELIPEEQQTNQLKALDEVDDEISLLFRRLELQ